MSQSELKVPFASLRGAVIGAVVGWLVGHVSGTSGFFGSLLGCAVFAVVEPAIYLSPPVFLGLRRSRRVSAKRIRASQPRWRQYLYRVMRNTVIACAIVMASVVALGFFSVSPEDMGVAEGDVSSEQFYLTLTVAGIGILAAFILLLWGVVLDFAEGQLIRAVLGIAAFIAEAIGVMLLSGNIERPDNVYAASLAVLLSWSACFIWNPIRWIRGTKYYRFSRIVAVVEDLVGATPRKVFIPRAPSSRSDSSESSSH